MGFVAGFPAEDGSLINDCFHPYTYYGCMMYYYVGLVNTFRGNFFYFFREGMACAVAAPIINA